MYETDLHVDMRRAEEARGHWQVSKGAVFQNATRNDLGDPGWGEGHNMSQLHYCGKAKHS